MSIVRAKDKYGHGCLLSSLLEITLNEPMLDTLLLCRLFLNLGIWSLSLCYPLLAHVLEICSTKVGRLTWK
jgi:hypothetical protein